MNTWIALVLTVLSAFSKPEDPGLNREEAKSAFEFLNQVRTRPQDFTGQFSFLDKSKAIHALRWSDTLARVAEARAMDMAKRNYFAHVDPDGFGVNYHMNLAGYTLPEEWLKDKKANFFESISAGSISGIEAVTNLLVDVRTPSLGHRKHLLGLTDWDASLVDIGIGYVQSPGSTYETYACVIIAKHNW
jgi:uncharacterized protein YkwD